MLGAVGGMGFTYPPHLGAATTSGRLLLFLLWRFFLLVSGGRLAWRPSRVVEIPSGVPFDWLLQFENPKRHGTHRVPKLLQNMEIHYSKVPEIMKLEFYKKYISNIFGKNMKVSYVQ